MYGVDYQEDGRRLSQNLYHDATASHMRHFIAQHCNWLKTFENLVAEDGFIVYSDEGRTVTIAPDVMLAKGPATPVRDGSPLPVIKAPHADSYKLADEGRPPDFVLEVVSPKNTAADLRDKKAKYLKIGIPEYFVFNPRARGADPPLKRYRLQPGGKAWEEKTSRSGLCSKELGTKILVNGQALELIDPETGQPYEETQKLKVRADREAARADREAAARKQAERELRELRSQLRSVGRRMSPDTRRLVIARRHSDEAARMEPPDVEAGDAASWGRPVALPDRATLTVGYEAGRRLSNYGERMIASGPRELVLAELQANGYTIASERPRGRPSRPPPGR